MRRIDRHGLPAKVLENPLDHRRLLEHLCAPDEAQIVRDKFRNFMMAEISGSGEIEDVPPELVQKLIDNVMPHFRH
jgi:hypothetical protein